MEPISFGFFHSNKHFGEFFPYKLANQIMMYNYAGLKNPAGPPPKETTDRELPKGPFAAGQQRSSPSSSGPGRGRRTCPLVLRQNSERAERRIRLEYRVEKGQKREIRG